MPYWLGLARKYHLYPCIIFDTRIVGAQWDADEQRYHIEAENVRTNEKILINAEILVSASGVLGMPHIPKISGLERFKGELFHSARWKGVALKGRRVGVIGNGASACVPLLFSCLMRPLNRNHLR